MRIEKAPPWRDNISGDHYKTQSMDISVDVLIIGGGIAGIASAYELSDGEKKIALIEKAILGSGATNHTTAFLGQIIDTDLNSLVSMFGTKGTKMIWDSGGKAIDLIEKNVKKEHIDCAFTRCSYFEFALKKKDEKALMEEAKLAKKLGFAVSFHTDKRLSFNHFGYNEIKNQGKFHPLQYIYGLAKAAEKKGVKIYEHTESLSIHQKDSFVQVKTNRGVINARQVLITTYAPAINKWEHFFKAAYYEDFMMELEIPKNSIPEALYADSNTPYTYFRIDPQKSVDHMIIGGLTHRIQVPLDEKKGYDALQTWIKKIFPHLPYKIIRKWNGRLIETDDGIPYIGKLSGFDQAYVATGFSGNGMTYSHISAMIFADILNGKKNEWVNLYDATRIPKLKNLMQKGKDYSATLIGGLKQHIYADTTR